MARWNDDPNTGDGPHGGGVGSPGGGGASGGGGAPGPTVGGGIVTVITGEDPGGTIRKPREEIVDPFDRASPGGKIKFPPKVPPQSPGNKPSTGRGPGTGKGGNPGGERTGKLPTDDGGPKPNPFWAILPKPEPAKPRLIEVWQRQKEPLPALYGKGHRRGAFRAIYRTVANGYLLVNYWLCWGPVQSITNIKIDGVKLEELGLLKTSNPAVSEWNLYLGTKTQAVDPLIQNFIPQHTSAYPGIAHLVVTFPPPNGSRPNVDPKKIEFDFEGLLVHDPRTDATLTNRYYRENLMLAIADVEISQRFGGRFPKTVIDWSSVSTEATDCDVDIGGGVKRFGPIGFAIDERKPYEEWLESLRAGARLSVVFNSGLRRWWMDKARASTGISLTELGTEATIADAGPLEVKGSKQVPNRVVVHFTNMAADWKDDEAVDEDPSLTTDPSIELVEVHYHLKQILGYDHAKRIARYLRKRGQLDKSAPIAVMAEGSQLLPGARFTVANSQQLNWANQDVVLVDCQPAPARSDWYWDFRVELYDASLFDDTIATTTSYAQPANLSPHDAVPDPVWFEFDAVTSKLWWDAPQVRSVSAFGAAFWSSSGLASFTASLVNNGSTAVNALQFAATTSHLIFDAGVGLTKSFREARLRSFNDGASIVSNIQSYGSGISIAYSDDGSSWTPITYRRHASETPGLTAPSSDVRYQWASVGAHRFWRFSESLQSILAEVELFEWAGQWPYAKGFNVYSSAGVLIPVNRPLVPASNPIDLLPIRKTSGKYFVAGLSVKTVGVDGRESGGVNVTGYHDVTPPAPLSPASAATLTVGDGIALVAPRTVEVNWTHAGSNYPLLFRVTLQESGGAERIMHEVVKAPVRVEINPMTTSTIRVYAIAIATLGFMSVASTSAVSVACSGTVSASTLYPTAEYPARADVQAFSTTPPTLRLSFKPPQTRTKPTFGGSSWTVTNAFGPVDTSKINDGSISAVAFTAKGFTGDETVLELDQGSAAVIREVELQATSLVIDSTFVALEARTSDDRVTWSAWKSAWAHVTGYYKYLSNVTNYRFVFDSAVVGGQSGGGDLASQRYVQFRFVALPESDTVSVREFQVIRWAGQSVATDRVNVYDMSTGTEELIHTFDVTGDGVHTSDISYRVAHEMKDPLVPLTRAAIRLRGLRPDGVVSEPLDNLDVYSGAAGTLPSPPATQMGTQRLWNKTISAADGNTVIISDPAASIPTLKWKQSVKAATTANGALATAFENGDTLDGVSLATGDRILIKNQTTASENGIYRVNASGAPTRTADADDGAELVSAVVAVEQGTVNAERVYVCTNNAITLGATAITFASLANLLVSSLGVTVDASNNWGFGKTNPASQLDSSSTVNADTAFNLSAWKAIDWSGNTLRIGGINAFQWDTLGVYVSSVEVVQFGSGAPKMTVLGFGTYNTAGAARFDVKNTTWGKSWLQHVANDGLWQLADSDGNKRVSATAGSGGGVGVHGDLHQNDSRMQRFTVTIYNDAGTIKGRIMTNGVDNSTAGKYASKVTGASPTLTAIPTVDNVTNFTNGLGIASGAANVLVFDTPVQVSGDHTPVAVISYRAGTVVVYALSRYYSSNVNGVTRNRLAVQFTKMDGTAFNLTSMAASEQIDIDVIGFIL